MAHFIVALHKITLTVMRIRLVLFCLRASNCIHVYAFFNNTEFYA